jgi:hypothetical protein
LDARDRLGTLGGFGEGGQADGDGGPLAGGAFDADRSMVVEDDALA